MAAISQLGPGFASPAYRVASGLAAAVSQRALYASGSSAQAAAAGGEAAVPDVLPVERLQYAITPAVAAALEQRGYAVIDGVFGSTWAARLRAEVAALRGSMHANHTHLVRGGATGLLAKAHIHEAELMLPETQAAAPLCARLQTDTTLRVMLSLFLPRLRLERQAIKLQWNEGAGGAFPCHYDSDTSVDTRAITAIWYLNPGVCWAAGLPQVLVCVGGALVAAPRPDAASSRPALTTLPPLATPPCPVRPGWQPSDGGELRVYPWPQGGPVDIAPLEDRLVLFSSQRMLHRVLPSATDRCCFTIWLSGGGNGSGMCGGSFTRGGSGDAGGTSGDAGRQALRAALAKDTLGELGLSLVGAGWGRGGRGVGVDGGGPLASGWGCALWGRWGWVARVPVGQAAGWGCCPLLQGSLLLPLAYPLRLRGWHTPTEVAGHACCATLLWVQGKRRCWRCWCTPPCTSMPANGCTGRSGRPHWWSLTRPRPRETRCWGSSARRWGS